jgi:hypothetical protein
MPSLRPEDQEPERGCAKGIVVAVADHENGLANRHGAKNRHGANMSPVRDARQPEPLRGKVKNIQ